MPAPANRLATRHLGYLGGSPVTAPRRQFPPVKLRRITADPQGRSTSRTMPPERPTSPTMNSPLPFDRQQFVDYYRREILPLEKSFEQMRRWAAWRRLFIFAVVAVASVDAFRFCVL